MKRSSFLSVNKYSTVIYVVRYVSTNGFDVSRHTELELTNARAGSTTIVRVYWESLKFNE